MKVAICFAQFGPYHHARLDALRATATGAAVSGVQIAAESKTYAWVADSTSGGDLVTLCSGVEENVSFTSVFLNAWRYWRRAKVQVAFLPSYAPASSLALLLSAKLSGVKCIMMNDSHAGTERAKGWKRLLKRFLVTLFDGAIVAGEPHRRYFVSLGMNSEKIVTGYDAVNNAYFSNAASQARSDEKVLRDKLGLPEHYLLSLGRLVEKKNLVTLVDAFAEVKQARPATGLNLAFVGSGECQQQLIERCAYHGLSYTSTPAEDSKSADVLFYGFRQINENPIFYALAEAFVLPSLYEEWGLVVNEAMACKLPIIVSATAGCAEDLVSHSVNGFHFAPTSSAELARHIIFLLDYPEERNRMASESLKRIQDWGCENFATNATSILQIITR